MIRYDGVVTSGKKLLPEPMLTQIYFDLWSLGHNYLKWKLMPVYTESGCKCCRYMFRVGNLFWLTNGVRENMCKDRLSVYNDSYCKDDDRYPTLKAGLCILSIELYYPPPRFTTMTKRFLKRHVSCTNMIYGAINKEKQQGAVSIRKTVLPGMAIPMLKIRRPNGRLIFNMEIAIRR